ncbi:MAG: transcriptional repressor LexA [Bacteroidetes bacterium]|nr:transcriptional repressor LexA [Bacteroidota bacterium]
MSRRQLTAKQLSFLKYIREYLEEHGVWPTYRDLADQFDYRSPNSVTQNLQALFKKGFLEKDEFGYQLVRSERHQQGIPVRGIIAAGALQEAVESDLGTITLETLFPNLDRLFAIRVSGQSMIDADISDGDYVLLVDDDIPNGGIGAVLYNGETSLKRVFRDKNGIRLVPANEAYSTIEIRPDLFEEVEVLGRYVGHVNRNGIYRSNSSASRAV